MIYADEKYMKWLEDRCDEYCKEGKKLFERKERYIKSGKDVPEKLNKRILEVSALYDYYDGLIKQNIEAELNMARKRQEAELIKSSGVNDYNIIPFGFNSFYGMSPFIR